jgi:Raf kinase inhibitor-like YbhB/YbcL family protein
MKVLLRKKVLLFLVPIVAALLWILMPRTAPPTAPYIDAVDESQNAPSKSGFKLTSSAVVEGSLLPKEFTCDGKSISPPIAWLKAPADTKSFAILMQHFAGPGDVHWYWVVHHIPSTLHEIAAGDKTVGITGGNSSSPDAAYGPPCSKGPGPKRYSITIYALSAEPTVAQGAISRAELLDAIKDTTLDHARLNFIYTR